METPPPANVFLQISDRTIGLLRNVGSFSFLLLLMNQKEEKKGNKDPTETLKHVPEFWFWFWSCPDVVSFTVTKTPRSPVRSATLQPQTPAHSAGFMGRREVHDGKG